MRKLRLILLITIGFEATAQDYCRTAESYKILHSKTPNKVITGPFIICVIPGAISFYLPEEGMHSFNVKLIPRIEQEPGHYTMSGLGYDKASGEWLFTTDLFKGKTSVTINYNHPYGGEHRSYYIEDAKLATDDVYRNKYLKQ